MMSRLSSRSLFAALIAGGRPRTGSSDRGEDVDDEVERGAGRDAGLLLLGVALGRRDPHDDAAADGATDQHLVPALDDAAEADRRLQRRLVGAEALVERLGGVVDLAEVVADQEVALLDLGPAALLEDGVE